MTRPLGFPLALTLLLALAGCAESTVVDTDSGTTATDAGVVDVDAGEVDAGPVGDVTYYSDVRPILREHCETCHVDGSIGPFPLDTYEGTMGLSQRIMEVTRDRIMPPYLADNSGDCQTFEDARWLSDRELEVLAAWHAQGAPEGDPTIEAPPRPELARLTGTISTIDMGVDYLADDSVDDDYRCFVAEAPIATGMYYLTGYEVHPGNPRTVHHVIVYAPQDDGAASEARSRDAAEAGPGYTCYGAAGVNALPVVLWAPGGGATTYPARTGLQLQGGRPLIIQVHYNNLAGRGMSDRTTVDLQTATGGITPAYLLPIGDFDMAVAPRMSRVTTSASFRLSDYIDLPVSPRIFGVFPHMHTLGRTLRVDLARTAGGADECLVDVPRWDFNWQLAYFYERPIRIGVDDRMTITCGYDTTSRTDVVRWGEGTQDEMCLNFVYVSL